MLLLAIVSLLCSFTGSMLSLAVWFHYDLEGWWEQRRRSRGPKPATPPRQAVVEELLEPFRRQDI